MTRLSILFLLMIKEYHFLPFTASRRQKIMRTGGPPSGPGVLPQIQWMLALAVTVMIEYAKGMKTG